MSFARTAGWGFAFFSLLMAGACDAPATDAPAAETPAAQAAPDAIVTSLVASSDGVDIAYDVRGAGPVLVLVHGWSCDRSYWDAQTSALAGDFRIVTVDVAGHGASGIGRSVWTIESFGDDVVAVMDKLDLKDAVLVGHSMGGDVVTEVARKTPERVKGVIWIDTYKQLGKPRTAEEVQALVAPFRADFAETTAPFVRSMFAANADPALVERVATDMSSAPPEVAVAVMEASLTYGQSIVDAIADVKAPIVAINPDNSPTDMASMTANGVDLVIMPGVGHFLMMEDPQRFNKLLKQTIAEKFGS